MQRIKISELAHPEETNEATIRCQSIQIFFSLSLCFILHVYNIKIFFKLIFISLLLIFFKCIFHSMFSECQHDMIIPIHCLLLWYLDNLPPDSCRLQQEHFLSTHVVPSALYEGSGSLGRVHLADPFWLEAFGCASPVKNI